MSSTAAADPAVKDILDFWFSLDTEGWFVKSSQYDKTITERFGPLVEKARLTDELDATWTSTPSGSLALIILLDQFTRNIFREGNHPEPGLSWSGDAKALRIAADSLAKEFDKQIQEEYSSDKMAGFAQRYFFYMPFMHAEDLPNQVASCALFEGMLKDVEILQLQTQLKGKEETEQQKELSEWMKFSLPFAKQHRDCVAALGRFPKRNEPLGRNSTEDEKKWLEERPSGL